jgi:hypothetical protein
MTDSPFDAEFKGHITCRPLVRGLKFTSWVYHACHANLGSIKEMVDAIDANTFGVGALGGEHQTFSFAHAEIFGDIVR